MTEIAVHIENLTKRYKLYAKSSDRLKETFHLFRKKYHHDFYALKNISFEIEKGKTIGIIGQNGAGKSTLLKILTGVLTPSSGSYTVNGKISSLLELGAGFNPDLTGIENVYFNGTVFGFSKQEIDRKLDDILAFADIGEFVNQKVRTYSSGMFVRLAFAVAVQVDPDVLIVDEALSVGDMRFQQKCFRRMREFKESGKTVLFVTHDQGTVTNFCDYVYWIKAGEVFLHGPPARIVKKYVSHMAYGMDTADHEETAVSPEIPVRVPWTSGTSGGEENRGILPMEWEDITGCASFGEGGVRILAVAFHKTDTREKASVLKGGEPVVFSMKIQMCQTLENLGVGISVNDHLGNTVFAIPSFAYESRFPRLEKGTVAICRILFDFPEIKNGQYTVSAAVAEGSLSHHIQHHWVHDAYIVNLSSTDATCTLGTVVVRKSRFVLNTDAGTQFSS
jgi:ABC-type polysaccharide/polyol phosphate transport system ATPase subunit